VYSVIHYQSGGRHLRLGHPSWLLAEHAGHAPPHHLLGALWRADRTVLAGDPLGAAPAVALPRAGQRALAGALGVGQEWALANTCAQQVADRFAQHGTWLPARESTDRDAFGVSGVWVRRVPERQDVPRPRRRSA